MLQWQQTDLYNFQKEDFVKAQLRGLDLSARLSFLFQTLVTNSWKYFSTLSVGSQGQLRGAASLLSTYLEQLIAGKQQVTDLGMPCW